MPHADPEKAREYFATRYQARKAADPEMLAAQRIAYRDRLKARVGDAEYNRLRSQSNRRSKYGLKPGELEAMHASQDGLCAICPAELALTGRKGVACVDHDHTTGKVRGLLCRACNVQVGFLEKDTTRALAGVEYILKHTQQQLDTGRTED